MLTNPGRNNIMSLVIEGCLSKDLVEKNGAGLNDPPHVSEKKKEITKVSLLLMHITYKS